MSSSNKDALLGDIGLSLEHDPELLYWTWKVHAENAAANMATLVQPTGLLTSMLTVTEWDAYGANRSVTPNGTVVIAPRPLEPTHDPIINGMTNAQISVAKYNNDRHQIWHEATATLKKGIIASLGPTLAGTIGPPPGRLQDDVAWQHCGGGAHKIWRRRPTRAQQNGGDYYQSPGQCLQLRQALSPAEAIHPHADSCRISD